MFGMIGKMLRVNLSDGKISVFSTDHYIRHYLGGRGIASRIYWEEVPPEVKPFDPANKLIFVNGPLVGTGAPAASVMAVAGKSPGSFPEGYCYGFFTGYVGYEFKRAGYDGLIVEGCAPSPVYLWIHDQQVQIRPATSLWGKSAYRSAAEIRQEHGEEIKWITIGVSGERKVRTAIALASFESTLSCGFGAVMGSKNLKAIAVQGSGEIQIANPEELVNLNRYTYSINKRVHLAIPPQIIQTGHGHLLEVMGKGSCIKCGSSCNRNTYRYGKRPDLVAMRRCQAMEYYLPWIYGHEEEPIETLFDAPTLANDYAIDTFELETVIRWLYACQQSGALTGKETGLPLAEIGTRQFLESLLHAIAYREGLGDLLAEGQLRAGPHLPSRAWELYTHQVNAIGQYETSPTRQFVVQSLLIPMEPRAHQPLLHATSFSMAGWGLNLQNPAASPIDTHVFHNIARAFWGSEEAGSIARYEGKPLAAVKIQDRVYLHDSLGLCNFTWPITYSFSTPDHVGDPFLEGKLYAAVTGLDPDQLAEYSQRIVDLQRAILMREGRKWNESDIPRDFLFSEPLNPGKPVMVPGPDGPENISGNKLDKGKYLEMLQDYYKLRKWSAKSGLPETEIPAVLS